MAGGREVRRVTIGGIDVCLSSLQPLSYLSCRTLFPIFPKCEVILFLHARRKQMIMLVFSKMTRSKFESWLLLWPNERDACPFRVRCLDCDGEPRYSLLLAIRDPHVAGLGPVFFFGCSMLRIQRLADLRCWSGSLLSFQLPCRTFCRLATLLYTLPAFLIPILHDGVNHDL